MYIFYCEIHLTVDNKDAFEFKRICEQHSIKYTEISFPKNLNKENHLMTSIRSGFHTFMGLSFTLDQLNLYFKPVNIIRTKIETSQSDAFKYIEAHLELPLKYYASFSHNLEKSGWVISFNVNKPTKFSITKRVDKEFKVQEIKLDYELFKELYSLKDKLELEYCIHDDNESLDLGWI